jgi:hypothetical protein
MDLSEQAVDVLLKAGADPLAVLDGRPYEAAGVVQTHRGSPAALAGYTALHFAVRCSAEPVPAFIGGMWAWLAQD